MYGFILLNLILGLVPASLYPIKCIDSCVKTPSAIDNNDINTSDNVFCEVLDILSKDISSNTQIIETNMTGTEKSSLFVWLYLYSRAIYSIKVIAHRTLRNRNRKPNYHFHYLDLVLP